LPPLFLSETMSRLTKFRVNKGLREIRSSIDAVGGAQQSKEDSEEGIAMAKGPVCARDVATPFVLNADAWRWLVCPHCAARLERKNPRFAVALMPLWIALIAVGGRGHRYAIVAEVLMAAIAVVILVEFMRPQLQLRKPLPKPEITLNIDGTST
jgi:hypothetical protein